MGNREVRHRTERLVFAAVHPLRRQLPASWLAGVTIALLTGGGVGIRLALAGDWQGFFAFAVAAVFVPTLALALGVWSMGSKLFEVVYPCTTLPFILTHDFRNLHRDRRKAGIWLSCGSTAHGPGGSCPTGEVITAQTHH